MLDALMSLVNAIIYALGSILDFILSLLPKSPFSLISNTVIAEYLPTLNYFIPVYEIVTILEFWVAAIAVYYIYQVGLRWIKAIE